MRALSPPSREVSPVGATRERDAPLATNSSTDANAINYGNLAESYNRTGSRLQRQLLEELDVIRNDNSFQG